MRNVVRATFAAVGLAAVAACVDRGPTAPIAVAPGKASAAVVGPVDFGSQTCPTSGGWTKIDNSAGSASGPWGSLSYPKGPTVTVNVNAGYTLELCIKSGSEVGTVGYTVTGPESGLQFTIAQAISHTSWRVTQSPPTTILQALSVSKGATASYNTSHSWTLAKTVNGQSSVTFTGDIGQSFPAVAWQVVADKTTSVSGYSITGQITITNPNAVAVGVSVTDVLYQGMTALGTSVAIDCGSGTATGTVPAAVGAVAGTLTCNYSASPTNTDATVNRADVTVDQSSYTPPQNSTGQITGGFATAGISWTENILGDNETTLADPRFSFSQLISADDTRNFSETFSCPTDVALYTNGLYTVTYTNPATLTGPNTNLSASATVTLNCARWVGETATGAGTRWDATLKNGPNNWFMYSTFAALSAPGGINLIAGQHFDAGQITATRSGGTTTISFVLHDGYRLANVSNNVKIHPMDCPTANTKYVQPGGYATKVSRSGSTFSVNVSNKDCYAIHLDVQRFVSGS